MSGNGGRDLADVLDDFENDDLETLADGILSGTVTTNRVDGLVDLFQDADSVEILRLAEERLDFDTGERVPGKPAVVDVARALEQARDVQLLPAIEGEDDENVEPTASTSEVPDRVSSGAQEALNEIQRVATGPAFTTDRIQDTLQAIQDNRPEAAPPELRQQVREIRSFPDAREDAIEFLQDLLREQTDFSRSDFPITQEVTDRGSGRGPAYFRRLERILNGERDFETIGDGLTQSEVEEFGTELQTMRDVATDVLDEFVTKTRSNRDALQRGQRSDTGGGGGSIDIGAIREASSAGRATSIVPGPSRFDYLANTDWEASDERIETEKAFMEWVLQSVGEENRWGQEDFVLQPQNRDISMRDYARLTVQNGDSTVQAAVNAGLPKQWFEGLDGDDT